MKVPETHPFAQIIASLVALDAGLPADPDIPSAYSYRALLDRIEKHDLESD